MRTYAVRTLWREALALVFSQRAFGLVTLLLVGASTMTVVTTAGRTAATEAAVLGAIDAQGTRTIVVSAKGNQPGIDEQFIATLARAADVEAVTGFGPVTDTTAAANPASTRLGIRTAYGTINGQPVTQPDPGPLGPLAWASTLSTNTVGLPAGAGSLRAIDGPEFTIVRPLAVPPYLAELEPLTIVPATPADPSAPPRPVANVYILARTPEAVGTVTTFARRLLVDVPPDMVTIETSANLANLRKAVSGELTQRSRGVILGVLTAAALTAILNVFGYTMMRRKDFGRRRALGATRLTIVLLISLQVLITATLAAALGAAAGYLWLRSRHSPLPPVEFAIAVAVAVTALTTIAAALPAYVAARRDPVRELRVP